MAEITHERQSYIWDHMPYARGLQAVTLWWEARGIVCTGVTQPSVLGAVL